jgi:hypothetical protein
MKYTLLEMTQRILESLGSDEVNSINDTVESIDVAKIIRETYYYLVQRMDHTENKSLFQLTASGDNTKPTLMYLPSNVFNVEWVKYNTPDADSNSNFQPISFLPLEDFVTRVINLSESDSNVGTMTVPFNGTNFTFKYRNDKAPAYYTTVDENSVIFDSYDSSVDTTLQSSKTLLFGLLEPAFSLTDNFVPKMDSQNFQQLLNEAKSQAFLEIKQMENPKAEQRARKSHITVQRTKENLPGNKPGIRKAPKFGR